MAVVMMDISFWDSITDYVFPSYAYVDLSVFSKEESKKAYDKCSKLNKEIKSANSSLKTMEEELQKAIVSILYVVVLCV